MSSYTLVEGLVRGLTVALVPGLHPMVFGGMEPLLLGVTYGVFTAVSIVLAEKGVYHAETAGGRYWRFSTLVKAVIIGILAVPVLVIIYGVRIPDQALLLLLVAGSLALLLRNPLAFVLSGLLGLVVLRLPVDVVSPLASGLFYIFGSLFLLGDKEVSGEADWKRGVLSAALTGYVPALPPSAWAGVLGKGDVAVAALLSPLFSLVALMYGKTRSAMSAYVPFPDPFLLTYVGLVFIFSALAVLSLAEIVNVRRFSLPREAGVAVMVGHALLNGTGNILLLLAAASLVLATKGSPSSYFGYIVLPTLLYYA